MINALIMHDQFHDLFLFSFITATLIESEVSGRYTYWDSCDCDLSKKVNLSGISYCWVIAAVITQSSLKSRRPLTCKYQVVVQCLIFAIEVLETTCCLSRVLSSQYTHYSIKRNPLLKKNLQVNVALHLSGTIHGLLIIFIEQWANLHLVLNASNVRYGSA